MVYRICPKYVVPIFIFIMCQGKRQPNLIIYYFIHFLVLEKLIPTPLEHCTTSGK